MARNETNPDESPRDRILDAFVQCVVEYGIERATYRAVAKRAGVGLGTVQHYFPEKDLLIKESLLAMHRQSRRRMERFRVHMRKRMTAIEELEERFRIGLPLTRERREVWPFYVEYWSYALRDREVRSFHVARWSEIGEERRALLADHLNQFPESDKALLDDLVGALIALQFGLSVNATMRPAEYPAARVRRLVRLVLDALLAHADAPRERSQEDSRT